MALKASHTPYRQLWDVTSNVAEQRTYCGTFGIDTSTAAVGTFVRPSAGSGATAGQGDLFVVTQAGAANQFTWLVALEESVGQVVSVKCGYNCRPTTAGTGGAAPVAPTAPVTTANLGGLTNNAGTGLISAWASVVDAPASGSTFGSPLSNTFYISLVDTAGTIPSSALTMPSGFTNLHIWFEVIVKPTIVPASL